MFSIYGAKNLLMHSVENRNFEVKIPYFDLNLANTTFPGDAMLINIRKKPDLTFVKIAHTKIRKS